VGQLYNQVFHRTVDPSGLATWTGFLNAGGGVQQLQAILFGSTEYFTAHGSTNTGFLQGIYQDLFGRAIDSSGAAFWGGMLANGASRQTIASDLIHSFEGEMAAVQMIYQRFLRRPADPGGLQGWTSQLLSGVSLEVVQAEILSSDEYFNRA
jgi:hypothetical protein